MNIAHPVFEHINCKEIPAAQFNFTLFSNPASSLAIQRKRIYELYNNDLHNLVDIYYMYNIQTDIQRHVELISLKDETNSYFSCFPIDIEISYMPTATFSTRRILRLELALGCANILNFCKIPKRSATYKIWMEYCGLKSNVSEITIIYRPYPRDIYAGS